MVGARDGLGMGYRSSMGSNTLHHWNGHTNPQVVVMSKNDHNHLMLAVGKPPNSSRFTAVTGLVMTGNL